MKWRYRRSNWSSPVGGVVVVAVVIVVDKEEPFLRSTGSEVVIDVVFKCRGG